LIQVEIVMGLSMMLLGLFALGGCALLAVALLGVVWVIVNERRSNRKAEG
jgi:hypothetical protein